MIRKNAIERIFTSIFLILLIILIFISKFFLILSLIILGIFSIIEFFSINKKIFKNKLSIFFSNFFFILYIFLFCLIFFIFSENIFFKTLIFILLTGCIASDIGGYVIGKFFKGPKLTSISPNKTISGSLGSFVFTCLIFIIISLMFVDDLNYKIFILALITSLAAQAGDLFFSFLKRKAKIKDTGNLLPGHGGVLDRLDGIFLGVPVGLITFILLN